MVAGDHRASGHRGDHRAAQDLDEPEQSRVRPRAVDTRARDHRRSLGRCEELRNLLELGLGGLRRRGAVALGRNHADARLVARRVHHRLRHLELHGPGSPGPHLAKGDAHDLRDPLPGQDRRAPLHAGTEGIELILALEGGGRRGIDVSEAVLRGDGHQGNTLVTGGDDARDEVRRARAGVPQHRRHLPGRLVETLRHVGAGCLVPERDEADLVGLQRGQQRIHLRARQPEHEAHPLVRETACEELSTGDLGHGGFPPSRELTRCPGEWNGHLRGRSCGTSATPDPQPYEREPRGVEFPRIRRARRVF